MALLTHFFAASIQELESLDLESGPGPGSEVVRATSIEPVKVATLDGILTGTSFEDLLPLMEPVRQGGGDEGPWVMEVRPELVTALAELQPAQIQGVARSWGATEEWQATEDELPILGQLISALGALGRRAQAEGRGLYYWIGL